MALFELTPQRHINTRAIDEICYEPEHKTTGAYVVYTAGEKPPATMVPSTLAVKVSHSEEWISLSGAEADTGWAAYQAAKKLDDNGPLEFEYV